ncbi:MAG: hypothetical protein EA344_04245 [Alkalicoccus sp.]|nr:MAG: hypothetical protein EA344_04245 [Alkalicoccus sp.]
MELKSARKKLEELTQASQELKNTYMRLDENEKAEFNAGYELSDDFEIVARALFNWNEVQHGEGHPEK